MSCQSFLKLDQLCCSAAISFCLLDLSVLPSHLCPSLVSQLWLPSSKHCVKLWTSGCFPPTEMYWGGSRQMLFFSLLDNYVVGVEKKPNTPSSHQVINVWTPPRCRTPTTQLYLAVMYHWCRSMVRGSITRISAPLSLTSGSCGVPLRPPATEKHSQHAGEKPSEPLRVHR